MFPMIEMPRVIRATDITRGDQRYLVSTVRLPYDDETVIWETLVFETKASGKRGGAVGRPHTYESEEEAISEHQRLCSEWQPPEEDY